MTYKRTLQIKFLEKCAKCGKRVFNVNYDTNEDSNIEFCNKCCDRGYTLRFSFSGKEIFRK